MKLENAVVLVTGSNRGLGLAFARELLARGARKVYAGARDPATVTLPGVEPIRLDVTQAADIAAAARRCRDATVLVNNAGIGITGGFLADNAIESARTQMETNFLGPLAMSRAFVPIIEANGGGAILNVLSVASWISPPILAVYAASKSAAWGLTNGLRAELRSRRIQVLGMHVGFVDTDLTRSLDLPKSAPNVVVRRTLDALEAGAEEVLADDTARDVKRGLSAEPGVYLQDIAG